MNAARIPQPVPTLEHWDLDAITPNPLNPRTSVDTGEQIEELTESIRAVGVLQPILITHDGRIIAGHRRAVAARRAGLKRIPAIVRDLDEAGQIEVMLVENLQRRSLTPLETARACQALRKAGLTLEQLAVRIGMATSRIRAHLQILELPEELQAKCDNGKISLAYVVHLVRLPTPELQIKLATEALNGRYRQEELARRVDAIAEEPPRKYPVANRPDRTSGRTRANPDSLVPDTMNRQTLIQALTVSLTGLRRNIVTPEDPALWGFIEQMADEVKRIQGKRR